MIRVYVEAADGERQAMFHNNENVVVCENIVDGEYIVNERTTRAASLIDYFGDKTCEYIFLDSNQFFDAVCFGTYLETSSFDAKESDGLYKIIRFEKTDNSLPAFLKKRKTHTTTEAGMHNDHH